VTPEGGSVDSDTNGVHGTTGTDTTTGTRRGTATTEPAGTGTGGSAAGAGLVHPGRDTHYIGGRWQDSTSTDRIGVVDPATEQAIGRVPAGTAADIDAAVSAARAALPGWAATEPARRGAVLAAARDLLTARRKEVAATVSAELGAPPAFASAVHVALPTAVLGSFAEIAAEYPFVEKVGNSTVYQEPVGVVGAITPWNYPLHQIVAKVAPALAAGCTVVLKPAENTPLVAQLFAEILDRAGLPAGVFNLVTGLGPVAGQALAEHPDVDLVSFTGSTDVGRRIGAAAGAAVKRVALELGGKSANVVLPGADLAKAVNVGIANVFANSGQTCSAWTRILVDDARYDEAVEIAVEAAAKYRPGDRLGPLISERQRDRVRGYINSGVEQGARIVAGGPEAPDGMTTGYYVRPTVLADVTPEMAVAQEEIFGPVVVLIRYQDEDDALRIANGTVYGLAGAVWGADEESAVAFARRMDTGQVDINGGRFNPRAPFGGYKQSGVGRELGTHGLAEYLQTKSLQF
jgi:aldehyde dehydrogenase (NAD+)